MYTFCWSKSERYKLVVGPVTHIARKFGEVQSGVYKFRTGRAYDVRIEHVDSTKEEPDYDYTANIEKVNMPEGVAFGKDDPDEILKEHSDWNDTTEFYAEGKTARIGLYRPTHTVSCEGEIEEPGIRYEIKYYLKIYAGGIPIDFPGLPCDEVIRWVEGTPWWVKFFSKSGPGPTKECPKEDGQWKYPAWQDTNKVAAVDTLGCPRALAKGYSAVQTITVDGVITEPTYTNNFDYIFEKKVWKE